MFEKIYRAQPSQTAAGAVGLGMNLVQHIIDAFGGQIRVESVPEQGPTVTITLPVGRTTGPPKARRDEPSAR